MIYVPKDLNKKVSCTFQKRRFHFVEYTSASQTSNSEVLMTECAVVYILKGKKEISIDGKTFSITAGQLFLLPKGKYVMSEYLPEEGGFKSIMLFFNHHQLSDIFNSVYQKFSPSSRNIKSERIQILNASQRVLHFYQSLENSKWENLDYLEKELLDIKIKELIYILLTEDQTKKSIIQFLHIVCSPTKKSLALMATENIYGRVSLGALAAKCHMSISTFKREFYREFSTSPMVWINERRLEKALLLIRNTDSPIADIAYECGFESYIHFARRFLAKYGKSASCFRPKRA